MIEDNCLARSPAKQHDAALLVVDVQVGFEDGSWGERNNPGAEAMIAQMLREWRRNRRPVIHVHHVSGSPAGSFHPARAGHRVKPEAAPSTHESVYLKEVNSAFIGTTLLSDLRSAKLGTLVVVGLTTPHCISTTARMAANHGFRTYVVSDATAAFEGRSVGGGYRHPESVHAGALADLHGEFATVVSSQDLIAPVDSKC